MLSQMLMCVYYSLCFGLLSYVSGNVDVINFGGVYQVVVARRFLVLVSKEKIYIVKDEKLTYF